MSRSRKINISVLSASVQEHIKQLKWHLRRPITLFFSKLYNESLEKARATERPGPTDDLQMFQDQLKLIPKWNQQTLETVIDLILGWFRNKHFQIVQSIKTVVVGRTMLMVAMGNNNGEVDERIRVDIPDRYTFIHTILSFAAHDLFGYPSLMRNNAKDTESDARHKQSDIRLIIDDAIDNTIVDQLSSPAVFDYLDQAMSADVFDGDAGQGVDFAGDDEDYGSEGAVDGGAEGVSGFEDDEAILDDQGFEAEAAVASESTGMGLSDPLGVAESTDTGAEKSGFDDEYDGETREDALNELDDALKDLDSSASNAQVLDELGFEKTPTTQAQATPPDSPTAPVVKMDVQGTVKNQFVVKEQ